MAKQRHQMIKGIDYKDSLCSNKSKRGYIIKRLEQLKMAKLINNEVGYCSEEIKLQFELQFLKD